MLAVLGLNSLWPKLLLILGMCALVVALVATIFMQGKKSAQVDQVVQSIKNIQRTHSERAKIEAMKSSDARQRLKDRWSRR